MESPSAAVGTKFHADGRVRAFPGCSVVSAVSPLAPQYALLAEQMEILRGCCVSQRLAVLPAQSLHMTVIDLVCDQVRRTEHWSSKLPLDAPLAKVRADMRSWLDGALDAPPLRVTFETLLEHRTTVKAMVTPADEETAGALMDLRRVVSERTGVRHPSHESYGFHISLAYWVYEPVREELEVFERDLRRSDERIRQAFGVLTIEAPKLVFFPDMHSFPPV